MISSYLNNISAQLKNYSATIDKTNILADKPWVLIDENSEIQKLIFKRNNELILSKNGNVRIGSWEYFPQAKSILIDRGEGKILCNEGYIDDAVMILKLDGSKNNFYLFANENLIPNLDALTYLKKIRAAKLNILERKMSDGRILEIHRQPLDLGPEQCGNSITINAENIPDGLYELSNHQKYILSEKSSIKEIYFKKHYINTKGAELIIFQKLDIQNRIGFGDILVVNGITIDNGIYEFSNKKNLIIKNGKIIRLEWKNKFLRILADVFS